MKLAVVIFALLLFAGCLYAKIALEPTPFWNGFVWGGLFLSPLVALIYIYAMAKESRK